MELVQCQEQSENFLEMPVRTTQALGVVRKFDVVKLDKFCETASIAERRRPTWLFAPDAMCNGERFAAKVQKFCPNSKLFHCGFCIDLTCRCNAISSFRLQWKIPNQTYSLQDHSIDEKLPGGKLCEIDPPCGSRFDGSRL
jgi:hypothetical protein